MLLKNYLKVNDIFLLFLVILISLPIIEGSAQIQTEKGEGVFFVNPHPFSFKDEKGFTNVLGEIYNSHDFPIQNLKLEVNFFNEISDEPIDSVIGSTLLDTVPAEGHSPFLLKSSMPNSAISRVSATLLGFDSSPEKQFTLSIEIDSLKIDNSLNFSGIITNNGFQDATNVKIHVISNDLFEPPRIIDIFSINLGDIDTGNSEKFSVNGEFNSRAVEYYIIAESNNFLSERALVDSNKIISKNRIVTLNNITATNVKQDSSVIFSPIRIGAQILMQEFSPISIQESYVFYVQIKHAESGLIEFIGSSSGVLKEETSVNPSIVWVPENEGLFFIETYVWNTDDVALSSSPGEILLLNINSE